MQTLSTSSRVRIVKKFNHYTYYSAGFVTTTATTDSLRKSQTHVLTCKKITECHKGPDSPAVKVNEVCEHYRGETFKSPGIKIKDGISFRRSRASCSSAGGLLHKMLP